MDQCECNWERTSFPRRGVVNRKFHLHLVSDATGETLNTIAKAACAQFENIEVQEHFYALVRSDRQLQRVIEHIRDEPGPVYFTVVNPGIAPRARSAVHSAWSCRFRVCSMDRSR